MNCFNRNESRENARGALCAIIFSVFVFFSCADSREPLIIWTNRAEFASYIELFNASQSKVKAIAVYKQFPAQSFPPARGEKAPDIIIAPALKNGKTQSLFLPLDNLFSEQKIDKNNFYDSLFEYGTIEEKTYLLPVSFNIPAIIFDTEHEQLIPQAHLISLDEIRETASAFNSQRNSQFQTMGFGPSWEKSFLYLCAKLFGTHFSSEDSRALNWNEDALDKAMLFVKNWTISANASTSEEEDFAFKYLFMPVYRQVISGRCLFASVSSSALFMIPSDVISKISFRWIHENFKIPAEDECIYWGINKKTKNSTGANIFTVWFFQEETQRALLERFSAMQLNTATFGIAGGFSGMRQVTERIFPTYYPQLLGNIPAPDYISEPDMIPPQWQEIKEQVIIPYLSTVCDTRSNSGSEKSLTDFLSEWTVRLF